MKSIFAIMLCFGLGSSKAIAQGISGGIFLPSDYNQPVDPNYKAKYQTMLLMIQQFYFNELSRLGHSKTFALEHDAQGIRVVVQVGAHTQAFYFQNNYQNYWSYAGIEMPAGHFSVMGPGAPSLGGGRIALTGLEMPLMGKTIEEQKQIFCDKSPAPHSEYDNWHLTRGELASIRMGGMAHELGHTFGLGHVPEQDNLMSAGFWGFAQHFTSNCIRAAKATLKQEQVSTLLNNAFFRINQPESPPQGGNPGGDPTPTPTPSPSPTPTNGEPSVKLESSSPSNLKVGERLVLYAETYVNSVPNDGVVGVLWTKPNGKSEMLLLKKDSDGAHLPDGVMRSIVHIKMEGVHTFQARYYSQPKMRRLTPLALSEILKFTVGPKR